MHPIEHALRIAHMQVDRNPSDAAKDSGTYKKGHLAYKGLNITIENPKGSKRSGVDADGKRWTCTLPASYGYLKGTTGSDGDHVDCYIGPDHDSDRVFVIDQVDARTGKFDEHKVMLSFANKTEALRTYEKAFSDDKGRDRIGHVTEMGVAELKDWLRSGNTKKPLRGRFADGGAVPLALQIAKKYRSNI